MEFILFLTFAVLVSIFLVILKGDHTVPQNKLQETIVVAGFKDIIKRYMDILETNGTDMHAGVWVTREGETSPDIDLIASGEVAYGIILDYANVRDYPAGYTLGQSFADNSTVKVLRRAPGVIVQTILWRGASSSLAVALGDPAYVIDGDSWDIDEVSTLKIGAVTNKPPQTPDQRARLLVGRFAKSHAAGTATNLITLVEMGP